MPHLLNKKKIKVFLLPLLVGFGVSFIVLLPYAFQIGKDEILGYVGLLLLYAAIFSTLGYVVWLFLNLGGWTVSFFSGQTKRLKNQKSEPDAGGNG